MKKTCKFMTMLLMSLFLFGITAVGMVEVHAATPKFEKKLEYYLYKDRLSVTYFVRISNPVAKGKITKLTNSNPKVVSVKANNRYGCLEIQPKQKGISKVSFRYAGRTFSTTITVMQYENPCQQFKIASINYKKGFDKSSHFNHNNRKRDLTGTISIKPKKGWKLLKIEVFNMYDGRKTVKNNSKIKLSINGTGTGVQAYFKNTKTGKIQMLYLGYSGFDCENENIYD